MRALALLIWLWAGMAAAECRQALALALDVSGSVDSGEYRMQLDGLAGALDDPQVRAALLQMPQAPVDVMVYEWSGPWTQRVLVPWTAIDGPGTLDAVITRLRGTDRVKMPPATALGKAMAFGVAALETRAGCWSRTLDISGDGKSNMSTDPRRISGPLRETGHIMINALVIGSGTAADESRRIVEIGELQAYFTAYVIAGPGAFTEVAAGFADYEAAMVRKLLRELQAPVLSRADLPWP